MEQRRTFAEENNGADELCPCFLAEGNIYIEIKGGKHDGGGAGGVGPDGG